MELIKTVQHTIVASSYTKVNQITLLIPTNDMALIIKIKSDLSCSHDKMRHSQKPSIYS